MEKRESWASRSTFILAAIGSAVGLGNAWRFPGLVAKHGGGAFLFVYLVVMLVLGLPLLMMEIAIGRKTRQGAPGAFRVLNKKSEWVGWAATSNAFVIATYYAIVFVWVLLMLGISYKFASMTGDSAAASTLFQDTIQTTWDVTGYSIPLVMIIPFLIAWGLIYYCIRNGASSVGKVVKYTVFIPVICLLIIAVKGLTMDGAMEGMKTLFIPEWSALGNIDLWIDGISQVFYSLSIMMAIMVAYGSFLDRTSNIAADSLIITLSAIAVSVLSGIVMFTTMYGCGMTTESMSDSGIATAFIIYPMAIVNMTGSGTFNAVFGAIFYLCLVTLAIDSAFSIIEGVSTAVADKFKKKRNKCTIVICILAATISLIFITRAGLAWLDIVDHWANAFTLIIVGIFECIIVGWLFDTKKLLEEVNKNTNKFKMPLWWFVSIIKFIAPILLVIFFGLNLYDLFINNNGTYSYAYWAEIVGGWVPMILCLLSGVIVKIIVSRKKKQGFEEDNREWDDFE
ncbi:MAG: sodium-dependent transporter [Clostridium sp.]|nr:sodium-dependent transporter [Clostridium sp.]MDY3827694.1 sodium-dependent transporter [Clostridium sp.]